MLWWAKYGCIRILQEEKTAQPTHLYSKSEASLQRTASIALLSALRMPAADETHLAVPRMLKAITKQRIEPHLSAQAVRSKNT